MSIASAPLDSPNASRVVTVIVPHNRTWEEPAAESDLKALAVEGSAPPASPRTSPDDIRFFAEASCSKISSLSLEGLAISTCST